MTTTSLSLEIIALATWAAASLVPVDGIAFSAGEGLKRTKILEINSTFITEQSTMTFGDQEHSAGEGMERTSNLSAEFADTYGVTHDGRPGRLVRRFTRLSEGTEFEGGGSDGAIQIEGLDEDRTSLLEGRTVAFEWEDESGAYSPSFADDKDGRQEWLAGLSQDLDLRLLLPEGKVDEGDSWTIEDARIEQLLHPGGQVMVQDRPEQEHDLPQGGVAIQVPDPASIEAWDGLEGDIVVTYAGTRTDDGVRLAVLKLEVDLEGLQDIAGELNRQSRTEGMPEVEYDLAELERTIEGQGELLWDLDLAVLHSYSLTVEFDTAIDLGWAVDMGGMDMPITLQQVSTGEVSVELSSE
jgi:hypothetical protein